MFVWASERPELEPSVFACDLVNLSNLEPEVPGDLLSARHGSGSSNDDPCTYIANGVYVLARETDIRCSCSIMTGGDECCEGEKKPATELRVSGMWCVR